MKKWVKISFFAIVGLVFIFLIMNVLREKNIIGPAPWENKDYEGDQGFVDNYDRNRNEENQGGVSNYGCSGKGAVNFSYSPVRFEELEMIRPLGGMSGEHVTPTDHQYYITKNFKTDFNSADLVNVYAPADGVITSLESMPDFFNGGKERGLGDYRMIIHHTCTFYTIYIHLYSLSPKILEGFDAEKGRLIKPIAIEAGELLGGAIGPDFSVHDENVVLKGFAIPEHYANEPWKIHTVDPFDYYDEPLKSQLITKSLRSAKPIGGKIDYDIDGKLIGTWFKENTNGYMGIKQPEYWETHISISPNEIDPSHFIISLGNFKGEAKQFGAKGNSPNPADIDASSGIVKYELVDFEFKDSSEKTWDRMYYASGLKIIDSDNSYVMGVVLLQIMDNGKLKVEIFPDKKASEVNGFSGKEEIYER